MAPSMIDEVFELLALAETLEEKSRIEAATKYYEAVYLMRRYLLKKEDKSSDRDIRQLLEEKVRHYEQVAATLMADDASSTLTNYSQDDFSLTPLHPPPPPTALHPLASQSPKLQNHQQVNLQKLVGLANQKLSRALDLDEAAQTDDAISTYMEAAEHYLEGLRLAELDDKDSPAAIMIKRRLQSTLDRVEVLKSAAPTRPSFGKVILPQKRMADHPPSRTSPQKLSAEEINILKASSLIASGVFLPWSDDDARNLRTEMKHSSRMYTDTNGFLTLSDSQKQVFDRWARPSEIARIRYQQGTSKMLQEIVIAKVITPFTIRQKYVTDCSFVASLCICANFERRFKKRLITSILYPQTEQGDLVHNPAGKYMVKLWLNGVARCVVIDDYFPIDKYGNLLCSHTSSSSAPYLELWVCLIEKAFLKLSGGGYGFPGSNSAVDMFSLTGWIPESVLFAKETEQVQDFETPPERAWERIMSASSFGDCLITVSSELDISEEEAEAVGLVTGHAYAVLNIIETRNGTRLLQLKNPWAHKGWKGRFSTKDLASWNDLSFQAEVGYDPQKAAMCDDGVFWICWDDVLRYFQNFHLSWNPDLFSHRTALHGLWSKSRGPAQDSFQIGENPQYVVELSDSAVEANPSLWILLSRHVTKEEQLEGKVCFC
jgi:calpain-7